MSNVKITVSGPAQAVDVNHLYGQIMNSVKSDSGLRKEIRRVFDMANKRIARIQQSGLYSPAVYGLSTDKFSIKKFGNGVGSWEQIVKEYGKAFAFLCQDTSTLTGTRKFNERIRNKLGLTKEEYAVVSEEVIQRITSVSGASSFHQMFLYYRGAYDQFESEMTDAAKDVSKLIEENGRKEADRLYNQAQQQAMQTAMYSARVINSGVSSIFEGLGISHLEDW